MTEEGGGVDWRHKYGKSKAWWQGRVGKREVTLRFSDKKDLFDREKKGFIRLIDRDPETEGADERPVKFAIVMNVS